MTIYIILYSLLFPIIFSDKRSIPLSHKKLIILIFVIIFTLFRGLRWECGTDWEQYHQVFLSSEWNNIFTFNRYGEEIMEYGYMFTNILLKSIIPSYTFFLLVTNFFILFSYYKFSFRYAQFPIITFVTLIFCSNFFPVRQNIAVAIALLSLPYVFKRKIYKFILLIIAAMSFHTSAIVFLPVYFIYRFEINIIIRISICILAIICGKYLKDIFILISDFIGWSMISNRLEIYSRITKEEIISRSWSGTFILMTWLYIFYISQKKLHIMQDKHFSLFINLYNLYLIITFIFATDMQELGRMSDYFWPSFCILFACFIGKCLYLPNKVYGIIYAFFIFYMSYKFIGLTHFYPELMFPYKSIFG